jgi:hypothetical protein
MSKNAVLLLSWGYFCLFWQCKGTTLFLFLQAFLDV